MMKEMIVSLAEIIEPAISVFIPDKPVFRALAVAGEKHIAFTALLRERVEFIVSELILFFRIHH